MSSRDNHIYHDIQELLPEESLTPEMEGVIAVMCAYRPRGDIDRVYRKKLKQTLLASSTKTNQQHTRSVWWNWLMYAGTSCAALIVTLSIVRIIMPENAQQNQDIPSTVLSGTPDVSPLMATSMTDIIVTDTSRESMIPSTGKSTNINTTLARSVSVREGAVTNEPLAYRSDMPDLMLGGVGIDGGNTMAAMGNPDTTSKNSISTTMETIGSDITSSVDSEMQDMIWEINSILTQAGSREKPTIPDYPISMPIYIKEGVFTTEEATLLVGSGISSTIMPTYTPSDLEIRIIERRGNMIILSTPEVRYMPYKKGNQSILVPTVIYTTASGSTLEVPLVEGY